MTIALDIAILTFEIVVMLILEAILPTQHEPDDGSSVYQD